MVSNSFFVGDALGRPGDWSDSDKEFAINAGLSIKTPEEVFPFEGGPHIKVNADQGGLLIGYPGSGKTTYSKYFDEFEKYIVLHGDELKTESKLKEK